MATGTGLNMRMPVKRGGYGATERGECAGARVAMASLSSRRSPGGRLSGQPCRCRRLPCPSRQCRKASGPRHWICRSSIGNPSMVGAASFGGMTSSTTSCRLSRRASHSPYNTVMQANGPAIFKGNSEAITAMAASRPSTRSIATKTRDGRQSRRQGADTFDHDLDFDIVSAFVAHEPMPEPIVFGFQKP